MDKTKDIDAVCKSVRELRTLIGETQQQFAGRMGLAISTLVRYELTRRPRGAAIIPFMHLAQARGFTELADKFRAAVSADLGHEVGPELVPDLKDVPPELRREFALLANILQSPIPKFQNLKPGWFDLTAEIRSENITFDATVSATSGLLMDLMRRLASGETEDEIVRALPSYDAELIKTIVKKLSGEGKEK